MAEQINIKKFEEFKKLARSLSLYGRHSLDTDGVNSNEVLDKVYIDPFPGNGAVDAILNKQFTALIGRKGTGKSILFNVCQERLSKVEDSIGVYVNCYEVLKEDSYDLVSQLEAFRGGLLGILDEGQIAEYLYRRKFIEKLLVDLIKEVEKKLDKQWKEKFAAIIGKDSYPKIKERLEAIKGSLIIPVETEVQLIKQKSIQKEHGSEDKRGEKEKKTSKIGTKIGLSGPSVSGELGESEEQSEERSEKNFTYQDYGAIFVSLFRPIEVMRQLFAVLNDLKIKKLYVFADDYSELTHEYQGLLSNSILSQYHQMSEFRIYLSIAGYPNRCYLGNEIDRTKVFHLSIDFEEIYKEKNFKEKLEAGAEFVRDLIQKRLEVFSPGSTMGDFFSLTSTHKEEDYYKVLFQASYTSPRIVGAILESCFTELASGRKINVAQIRTAAQKFYENRVSSFIRESTFSIRESDVPFFSAVDVYNQVDLLDKIADELKEIQTKITETSYEKIYGKVPPVSHFHVSEKYNEVLKFLSNNYFINKVGTLQAKTDKINASIYALNLGLCTKKSIRYWEYDPRAKDYLKERFFYLDRIIENFLETQKEIVCSNCKTKYPISALEDIKRFHWMCQTCGQKACSVIELNIAKGGAELAIPEEVKLPHDDLQILDVLNDHQTLQDPLYPKDIAGYVDKSYQFVTRRMRRLADEKQLISYSVGDANRVIYTITDKAKGTYF